MDDGFLKVNVLATGDKGTKIAGMIYFPVGTSPKLAENFAIGDFYYSIQSFFDLHEKFLNSLVFMNRLF